MYVAGADACSSDRYGNNTLQVAVDEKYTAIDTWSAVKQDLAAAMQGNTRLEDCPRCTQAGSSAWWTSTWAGYVNNSAQYGYLLAKYIASGWKVSSSARLKT